jgi:hypothetical protein
VKYYDFPILTKWIEDSTAGASKSQDAQKRFLAVSKLKDRRMWVARDNIGSIDVLVDNYKRAWSSMAKINVLSDLKRLLPKVKITAVQAALDALLDIVTKELEKLSGKTCTYDKVICIAWEKATSTLATVDGYVYKNTDDEQDMKTKCADMYAAIDKARESLTIPSLNNDDKTLKVFMAPEFYFRGQYGAYVPQVVHKILPEMDRLGIGGSDYKDWLFVLGTAVAGFIIEEHVCDVCGKGTVVFEPKLSDRNKTVAKCKKSNAHTIRVEKHGAEVQNVALLRKGPVRHMIVKEWVSSIDYAGAGAGTVLMGDENVLIPGGSVDYQWGSHPCLKPSLNDERLGGCSFTVNGIRFALEICLDHDDQDARAKSLSGFTQILLIPSCGMSIGTGLYCVDGGVAFNVDGNRIASSEVKVKGSPAPLSPKTGLKDATVKLWPAITIPPSP